MLAAAAPVAGAAGGAMNPLAMLATQSLAQGLGGALGGQGGPTVSGADGNRVEAIFDNSGWNVAFGESKITSDRQQLPAIGGMDLNTTTMLMIGAAALIAFKIWSKKQGGGK